MRQTQDNIRCTLHIMPQIKEHKLKALILSLDAEKAFHSFSWQYLYKVSLKFRFNDSIINSIKAIYDNPTARFKINGYVSKPIILERGVRQGCARYPPLFTLLFRTISPTYETKR